MYTPPNASSMKDAIQQPIRLLLIGAPGSGKTYSALTFPNIIVADTDNGMNAHVGRDIVVLKFWDMTWVKDIAKLGNNKRDAIKKWIETEAPKLTAEQTLVIDSWTALQDSFDIQTDKEPTYTKTGQIDEFAFWGRKMDYARDICDAIRSLKCNVVVCCHEQVQRDSSGNITSKIMPVMQGKFCDKMAAYFSDVFRQVSRSIKNPDGTYTTVWNWQVVSDNLFNAKTRMSIDKLTLKDKLFVDANYSIFKY